MDPEPPHYGLLGRYILLVLIWSTTPLAVVLSVHELHAIWALFARFLLATPLAAACLWLAGLSLPLHRKALRSYVAGAFSLFGAMLFTYLGAVYLPSALISLLFGLAPLLLGLLSGLNGSQILRREQWLGLLLAFAGLCGMAGGGQHASTQLLGVLLVLIGVGCYGFSVLWLKHENAGLHPLAQTTGSLALSTLAMLPVLPFYAQHMPQHLPSLLGLSALLYSVVMASVVAMLCYFHLVEHLPPATVSLTTLMTPLLALCWGAWLNHERFSSATALCMLLMLAGLLAYFAPSLRQLRRPAAAQV